jgi:signal peptidase I
MIINNSNNDLKLSGQNLTDLMRAVLGKNADFRFQANGHSMSPFIKDQDIITISPLPINRPKTGDIVAASFLERKSIMVHRVIGNKHGRFIIKGDNNRLIDGSFEQGQIIGIVTKVERDKKRVWYGKSVLGSGIALLSKFGILNSIILPVLRKLRRFFPF